MGERNFGKTYDDKKDGKKFQFVWEKYATAFRQKARQDGITLDEMRFRLSERLDISGETIRNHLRDREKKAAVYPRSIETVKNYGLELTGDAYAFLDPLGMDLLATEVTEKELRPLAHLSAIEEDAVKAVFEMLYDLLSLYAPSGGFNYIPGTDDGDGAWDYFEKIIDRIRKKVVSAFLRQRNGDQFKKLSNIIDETELFVKSFSVPGVVDRWRTINPAINYFDCVYDIIEEMGREGAQRLEQEGTFSYQFFPDESDILMREQYFCKRKCENAIGNLQYSEERIFQMELLETLVKVFEYDFCSSVESDYIEH